MDDRESFAFETFMIQLTVIQEDVMEAMRRHWESLSEQKRAARQDIIRAEIADQLQGPHSSAALAPDGA
jgi:hypothetical protein